MKLATQATNGAFSATVPGLQVIWDSSSLSLLKECPRKYYYTMACGFNTRHVNIHLRFGTLFHSALEHYDHLRADGKTHRAALLSTARMALMESGEREPDWPPCQMCEHTGWHIPDTPLTKTFTAKCRMCDTETVFKGGVSHKFVPWTEDPHKNRITLVRSVIWYLDQYKNDTAETYILENGKPAVELSFKIDTGITAPDGSNYAISGHIDKIVRTEHATHIRDYKTTKSTITDRFFQFFSPDNQMSIYIMAGKTAFTDKVQGAIIDGAQIMQDATRFVRGTVSRTPAQIEEWWRDIQIYLAQNETYVANSYWPQNDKSCDKYGGCPYLSVCSKDPAVRGAYLKEDFVKRIWDPSVSRGVSD